MSEACLDDPTFSRTKLLKILFFSDFEAFGRYGKPITGMPYKKLPYGPAPAMFPQLQAEMLRDQLIRIVARRVYEHERQRVLPLKAPDVEHFSAREISLVDSWIRFFWNKTAKEVSRYSHGKAWKLANEGDSIPYEAVFISNEPVTDEDAATAKNLASKYGWKA
ncbi:MAG: SocA family protein [Acidobacteriaceae bacterium]|nr:SocA family protein [Acidobacteriaceae bacterium]